MLQWYLSGITTSDVLKEKENIRTFSTCKRHIDVFSMLKVHESRKVMSEEHMFEKTPKRLSRTTFFIQCAQDLVGLQFIWDIHGISTVSDWEKKI